MTPTESTTNPSDLATDVVEQSVAAYTEHAAEYETFNADAVAETAQRFIDRMPAAGQVLDAGCGPGRDLARFIAAGLDAVGVDLNPTFVQTAETHGPAWIADLRDLPFGDDAFDGVWACASLVHLPVDDARTALRELVRVTRPGGTVYVSVKHAGDTGWAETAHGRRWFRTWTPEEFTAACTGAGLTVESTEIGPVFIDVWATA